MHNSTINVIKNNKGITLISLVVIIIVMIILAAVSINLVFGNNGIIARANEAKRVTIIAREVEGIELVIAGEDLKAKKEGRELTLEDIEEALLKEDWIVEANIEDDILIVETDEGNLYEITIDQNGNIVITPAGTNDGIKATVNYVLNPASGQDLRSIDIIVTAEERVNGIETIELEETEEIIECNGEGEATATFTVTRNRTYTIKVTTTTGQITRKKVTITQIGTRIITITPNITDWTNQNVQVEIQWAVEMENSTKEYSLDNGSTWNAYTGIIVISKNCTIIARESDITGTITASLDIVNIDKIAPILTISQEGQDEKGGPPPKWSDEITAVAEDYESGIYSITKPDLSVVNATTVTYIVEENGAYTFTARDKAGNTTSASIRIGNIDREPPDISGVVITPSTTDWTYQDISISLANYWLADASIWEYKIDNGEWTIWTTYYSSFTVSDNCTIYVRARDGVGNYSGEKSLVISNIEKTAPTIGLSQKTPAVTVTTGGSVASVRENVPIPQGFYYVGGTKNTGIVISDNVADENKGDSHTAASTLVGNQFVWVPVRGEVIITANITHGSAGESVRKYAKGTQNVYYFANNGIQFSGNTFSVDENGTYTIYTKSRNGKEIIETIEITDITYEKRNVSAGTTSYDDTLPSGVTSEKAQVKKYGGFYIARYESGKEDGVTTPISKQNSELWNRTNYTTVKQLSESMYTTSYVKSGLVTGSQWDSATRWLEDSGYNVSTDSSSWGNYAQSRITGVTEFAYSSSVATLPYFITYWTSVSDKTKESGDVWLLKTGNTSYTKANNIYDLAGNLIEYTSELYKSQIYGDLYTMRGRKF